MIYCAAHASPNTAAFCTTFEETGVGPWLYICRALSIAPVLESQHVNHGIRSGVWFSTFVVSEVIYGAAYASSNATICWYYFQRNWGGFMALRTQISDADLLLNIVHYTRGFFLQTSGA